MYLASNDLGKAVAIANCASKCNTTNVSDLKAITECLQGCANGAFFFKANAIVMVVLFFMSYYLIN